MRDLYSLTLYDDLDSHREGFFIGIFDSYDAAESTAKMYLSEVAGFNDYPCKYEIKSKSVIGGADAPETVSMIWGWNLTDDSDEVDIWESDLYADKNDADAALDVIMQEVNRREWCINTYQIGECGWRDGFVRV